MVLTTVGSSLAYSTSYKILYLLHTSLTNEPAASFFVLFFITHLDLETKLWKNVNEKQQIPFPVYHEVQNKSDLFPIVRSGHLGAPPSAGRAFEFLSLLLLLKIYQQFYFYYQSPPNTDICILNPHTILGKEFTWYFKVKLGKRKE